ncbi:hypothetical protein AAG589_18650 [Isoptericola sp. F-RaC21]|uniref:hypothetical protein n=1 Tax=Isoptericola sp. F-RaC21 TaxID=3141452 RepID=UPI00315BB210
MPASARPDALPPADQRAVLRFVGPDGDPGELPRTPEPFLVPAASGRKLAGQALLLLVVSVAAVWLVTVRAWDDEAFFPWFWNPLWTVFPWLFLAPAWWGWWRAVRPTARMRASEEAAHYARWSRHLQVAVAGEAVVLDVAHREGDDGRVSACTVGVEVGPLTIVPATVLGADGLSPAELPRVGDRLAAWRLPGERTVVQARRSTAPPPAPDARGGHRGRRRMVCGDGPRWRPAATTIG